MREITPVASNVFEKVLQRRFYSSTYIRAGTVSEKRLPLMRKEVSSLASDVYLTHVG